MCGHYGGFQSPQSKRTVQSETENRNSSLTHEHSGLTTQPEESGLSAGIVDECCRKQCALSTLISYCANGGNATNERLSELESLFSSNAEALRENQMEENTIEIMANNPDSAINSHIQVSTGPTTLNLGTNSRNRPVFIVLPQVYEDINSNTSPEESYEHSF
ncbi:bombyxin B-2 [Trichonephila clavata]|uniref:Bombyxin B-2 n=1 Tax=Trichonephila clavata TaxID=2740835 RepID=A0A8X6FNU3_TRICU|nr:bombyxin B-2 [Trichonephila clavata]